MKAFAGRLRGAGSWLGGYLGLALILGLIVVLIAAGVLPERRWAPFGDIRVWQFLAQGLWVTVQIGAVALVASLVLAVPLAVARLNLSGPLRWLVVSWIELVRATPVLALILGITLFMPRDWLSPMWSATLALTIYTSAVLAEILRAGILSIPKGEVDAARSLGLTYAQTMRLVVLPQAFSRMMPALVSQMITLVKDTSLASIAAVSELAGFARSTHSFFGNPAETYFLVACIYFVINYTLSRIARRLELRRAKDPPVTIPLPLDDGRAI
ncbi:MAG TPA: amino acid ABC transporter permease [Clostridia bacterium]|nr:amino acid ABC transporter permease [Clostridia bacterium]